MDRRRFCAASLAAVLVPHARGALDTPLPANVGANDHGRTSGSMPVPRRRIPSSGATLPPVGMGTWITFDLPPEHPARATRVAVLKAFFDAGGGMIDSSPMYGHAEELLGHALERTRREPGALFSASKIWTPTFLRGERQMDDTERLWGAGPMDLMQVHNLVDWESHLPRLREWREEGRIAHVGVTTSHGRRHAALEAILRREPLDFVQLTYNARDREAERRLLPLARERGVAVIVNRPYQRGAIPRAKVGQPLPGLARELGCGSWAQLALLFAISHPAVTCAIPATGDVAHLRENMAVAALPMPDDAARERIAAAFG